MWLFLQQVACKCFMEVIATSSGEMKIDRFFYAEKGGYMQFKIFA